MIGTLTLRPTLSQRVVHESVRSNGTSTSKVFSETTLSGTVFSDWARHQLSVTGSGTWQKKLSGTGTESPNANLDALLRLDLINDITATLGAGYSYSEENETDPNAISGPVPSQAYTRRAQALACRNSSECCGARRPLR
jgi:hypothetical protein